MKRGEAPPGLRLPRRSALHDLLEAEQERPTATVLRYCEGGDWTAAQLADAARGCAATLQAAGVKPGDRVALMSRGDPRLIAWWFGVQMTGAVEVDVNADLRGPLLDNVIRNVEPALIVASDEGQETLRALGDMEVPLVDVADARGDDDWGSVVERRASDLATIMHTSGTTGPSKGVMLSHGYFANHGALFASVYGLTPGEVVFNLVAPYHADAHVVVAACLQSGAICAFPARFSASRFWEQVSHTEAETLLAVGAQLDIMARCPAPDASVPIKVRRAIAAPITPNAREHFEGGLGIELFECYGQTEGDFVTYSPPWGRRPGSVGLACGGFDIAIVDNDGHELTAGQSGEIVYRPNFPDITTIGYWHQPEATLEACRGLWWRSGDRGHLDDDGYLYFDGRLRDSLRRRGENVSAWELEAIVREAPGVADVAAVAVRDEIGGEDEIKLFIVVQEGHAFDPDSVFAFCRENLARFAVPRFLEPIDAAVVVRSPGTGVIQKHRLPSEHGPEATDRLGR